MIRSATVALVFAVSLTAGLNAWVETVDLLLAQPLPLEPTGGSCEPVDRTICCLLPEICS